ncbi:transcription factor SPT20 homolog [Myotis myotis]|uniref:transcription factor SPT20 homolog n=1 Tax=Myotis myotis TaxID=51298 RepID=UPI00174A73A6|nr:transcription factor SPT20 homolog [Myotis myotis]
MRRALERALDHAECGTESAQQRPPKRKASFAEEKSLHEKLYDMYVEEFGKEPEGTEELTRNVNLLEMLVRRESLPRLVVSLYPGEEGYSLMITGDTELYSEIIRLPYEERDFLDYLDAGQLCPDMVDVLERSRVNVFQSGCVITEVRDFRQCTNVDRCRYERRHVLLRPAMQTLASDTESITTNNQTRAQEDRLSLESQPILAAAEPLCPDPSVSVACSENKLVCNEQKMNTPAMERNLQEDYSAASLHPQQELPCSPPPPELSAWAPDQESQADQDDLEIFTESCVDMWEQLALDLQIPLDLDIEKFAEDWPFQYDDANSIIWPDSEAEDDSLFGCEGDSPSQTTKPTVMQSQNDPFISGERSPKKVRRRRRTPRPYCYTDDHSYCLRPGSKTRARKATRESKKLVKRDKCAVRVAEPSSVSPSLIQLSPGRAAEQPSAVTVQSAAQDQGGQHAPPVIRIPCSSGNSSLGKPFTSQQAGHIRIPQLPSPAPAWEPPSLPQKPAVQVKRVRTLPTATVTSASTSQATPVIQVKASSDDSKVVQLLGPVRVIRTVVRGCNPIRGSPCRARAPSGVKPSSLPSGGQPKNAGPAAPQAPTGGVQYVVGNLSSLRPVKVLWVPQGSDISAILQQAQQQQQVLYPLIPQPLQQQPPTSHLPQPVVQVSCVQGSSRPQRGLSAPQAAVTNLNGVGSVLQSQRVELSQPAQRPSQLRVQLPAAFQKLPQSQGRIVHLPQAVATASVQPAQPAGGGQTAGQPKGPENGGLPSTPKC